MPEGPCFASELRCGDERLLTAHQEVRGSCPARVSARREAVEAQVSKATKGCRDECSLFRSDSGWAVFAVVDGRAHLMPVEIGWRNGITAEVASGLTGGERVVLHPPDAIAEGVPIEEREP